MTARQSTVSREATVETRLDGSCVKVCAVVFVTMSAYCCMTVPSAGRHDTIPSPLTARKV